MRMKNLSLCLMVSGLAGLPAGLATAEPPTTRQSHATPRDSYRQINFETFTDFNGREVYNDADENIATIKDLIVDRGTGEAAYAVVQTGDILGFGGKMIAIPYDAFEWDRSDKQLTLRYTKESLEKMSEFRPESWAGLLTEDNAEAYEAAYSQLEMEQSAWENDPYAEAAKDYPTLTIDGVVHEVVRPSDRSDKPAYLVVNTERDGQRKIILGPSWFVMGYTGAPERGDTITIRAYEVPREDGRTYVARTFKTPRGEMTLRSADGRGMWSRSDRAASADFGYVPFRYTLLSEVVGSPCTARGVDCGEVQQAVIECTTGTVAFLAIDPNENFLGLGDDLHLVPWSVSRVFADSVSIDASKQMIVGSSPMPENIEDLDSRSNWSNAYRVFEVKAPEFDREHAKRYRGEHTPKHDGSKK